jgi:hypothetical protein
MDASRYHRWFSLIEKDAMGDQKNHRGYSDQNLWVAKTDQDQVAGMAIDYCTGKKDKKTCVEKASKWSYAIPLEIIYLTPLYKWNPYNIRYSDNTEEKETDSKRNGQCTKEKAIKTHVCCGALNRTQNSVPTEQTVLGVQLTVVVMKRM